MKFGVDFPYGDVRTVPNYAHLAEEAGWDGFFLGDAIWCADAMTTSRIRLGTMVIPVPLRRPWKIASESIALDHLSGGRLTLGLGTGAVWMGWQGFPDEVTDAKIRGEMLDETIDILTLLYRRKQFDYNGKHYHLKLTLVDEMHYPSQPVQKPRIPLWVVGVWPRQKSMRRVLKCDGVIASKMNPEGKFEDITPADIHEMKAYVGANRTLTTPFDIVVEGKTIGMDHAQIRDKLSPWAEAGATWWVEDLGEASQEQVRDRLLQGPPQID